MLIAVVLTCVILTLCLWKRWKSFQHWQLHGIPTLPNANFIFGNFADSFLLRQNLAESFRDAHFAIKRAGHQLAGLYMLNYPVLLVVDAELAKSILQSDFDYFTDRGMDVDIHADPIQAHLFNLPGEEWKNLRRKLSPTFSSGKIKGMYPLVEQHCDILAEVLKRACPSGDEDIHLYNYLKKCGIDIIGHIAFGLDCNTLEGENEIFYQMSSRIFAPRVMDVLKVFLTDFTNPIDLVKLTSSNKEAVQYFTRTVQETVAHRRRSQLKSVDFLQLLIDLVDDDGSALSMTEIVAQAFLFFIAGFETSATTVNFAMYLLASNPPIQRRLRREFRQALDEHKGVWSYELVMNHEYLDCVIKEALRLCPPAITLNRKCLRNYKHDPENFENPSEFIPDRFSRENAKNIKTFTYFPFGEGPRFCIGKRFGYLNAKLELMKIIMQFEVTCSKNMKPFRIDPITRTLILAPQYPLIFNLKLLS